MGSALTEGSWHWLLYAVIAMCFAAAHFLMEPARWRVYATTLPAPGARFLPLLHVFNLTAMISYVLPAKLGVPLRIYFLRSRIHLGLTDCSAFMVFDGVFYYGWWTVVALLGSALIVQERSRVSGLQSSALLFLALAATFLVLIVLAVRSGGIRKRIGQSLRGVTDAMRRLGETRILVATCIAIVIDISFQGARHCALAGMLGVQVPFTTLFIASIISIGVGLLSFLPMGLGGYDVTLVLLLGLSGVPAPAAVAIGIANRLVSVLTALLLGGWSASVTGVHAFRLAREWREKRLEGMPTGPDPSP